MHAFDCLGDPVRRRVLAPRIGGQWNSDEEGAAVPEGVGKLPSGVSRSACGCCATMSSRSYGQRRSTRIDLS